MIWDLTIEASAVFALDLALGPTLGCIRQQNSRLVATPVADHDLAGGLRALDGAGVGDGSVLGGCRALSPRGPGQFGEVVEVNLSWSTERLFRMIRNIGGLGLNAVAIVAPGTESLREKLGHVIGRSGHHLERHPVPRPVAVTLVLDREVPSALHSEVLSGPGDEYTSTWSGNDGIDLLTTGL